MKRFVFVFILQILLQPLFGQWCNRPNQSFCPGNFFQNGDFENVAGNPNARTDQDINLANGWQAMWSRSSLADLHCTGGNRSTGQAPNPNSNVYAGMWIENRPSAATTNSTYREGMYNQLATPIAQNSGSYSFNFNMANALVGGAQNNLSLAIGIYGVFNPSQSIAAAPTGANSNPLNVNLWQSVDPTVQVVLLGVVNTPAGFTNTWAPQTITFNSNILPSGGITHIMVTAHDAARPATYRKMYVNFDEFCLQVAPSNSVYCCEGDNLVRNGDFESGDNNFVSQYVSAPAGSPVKPGEYSVIDFNSAAAICPNWDVQDHTFCINGFNSQIMVVNGQTQQSANANNVIWQTDRPIRVERDSQYRFCANLQNLPQCCFDIYPKVSVQIRQNGSAWTNLVNWTTIDINPDLATADPCNWQEIGGVFTANGGSVEIRIQLDELGQGDGNDLALDDISLQKLSVPKVDISVQHTGVGNQITASINQLANGDDVLPGSGCKYTWMVGEVVNLTPTMQIANSKWGDASIGWGLTTTFPGYNFQSNKLYIIALFVYECDCLANGFTYQLTYDARRFADRNLLNQLNVIERSRDQRLRLEREVKVYLEERSNEQRGAEKNRKLQEEGYIPLPGTSLENAGKVSAKLYPNPFNSSATLEYYLPEPASVSIQLYDANGKSLRRLIDNQWKESGTHQQPLDRGNLPAGVYYYRLQAGKQAINNKLIISGL